MDIKTLLQKAKEIKSPKELSDEEYDLAIACAKGLVTLHQVKDVMKYSNINSVYVMLSRGFRRYIAENNNNQ